MTTTEELITDMPEHSVTPQPPGVVTPSNALQHSGVTADLSRDSEPDVIPNQPDNPPILNTTPETAVSLTQSDDNIPEFPDARPLDPNVATLLGMFPDFDASLVQSVLYSVSGDQDKAIDVLLGMSDPEFKPTARPDANQTQLDEEIARRLLLEETEQQQRSWQPQAEAPRDSYRPHAASHRNQQRSAEGEGVAQFQEQLGKFAETGMKTFNTLFSKVKAKIQEFDNPPGHSTASSSGNPLPRGDSWNTPAQAQSYYVPAQPESFEGYNAGVAGPPRGASMNQGASETTSPADATMSTATAPPTRPAAPGGNVDPSKIGLLPKRPVSLGSSAQPSGNLNDDDVEYVENPFEDSSRR